MTTKEEVKKFISQLEEEAMYCEEIGSNFSASAMLNEAERLQKLLDRGIVPQNVNTKNQR
jgi:hypothetical protein